MYPLLIHTAIFVNFYHPIQCLHFSLQPAGNTSHCTSNRTIHCEPLKRQLVLQLRVYVCVCLLLLLCSFGLQFSMLWRRLRANKFNLQRVGELRQVFAAFIIASTSRRQGRRMVDGGRGRGRDTAPNETPFTNLFIYIRRIYFITRSKCSRAESATGTKKRRKPREEKKDVV